MTRRALLIGLVLVAATAVAGEYHLSILVGSVPPRGGDLRLVGPDGGVVWEEQGVKSRRHLATEFMNGEWNQGRGRYRLVATPPAPLRACTTSFAVEDDTAFALFGVNVGDGGCRISGTPTHSLLGRTVGDYPPCAPPHVQPATK